MGVVSLLLLFEFLILLLHPPIGELTHHNKVLELLMLVVIGAGLVPLHHRLEHLLIERLTKHRPIKQPAFHDDQNNTQEVVATTSSKVEKTASALDMEEDK